MTTEACVTKLAYLFGRLGDSEKVKQMWDTDIRGEVTINEGNGASLKSSNSNNNNSGNKNYKNKNNSSNLIQIQNMKAQKSITSRL